MRRVFRTIWEVCKVWAEDKQDEGRAGNVEFKDKTIYSYGWWPMAKIIRGLKSEKVVLYRNETYTPTTGRHQGGVLSAVSGRYPLFKVADIDGNHQINVADFLDRMKQTVILFNQSIFNGRWVLRENNSLFEDLIKYCKEFKLKVPVTLGLYLDPRYPFVKNRFYSIEGREVFLPKWLSKKGMENVESKDLLKTRNAEIRREIIRIIGIDRICKDLSTTTIDKTDDYELIFLDLKDSRLRPFLKMKNPSVPDIWHIEGVHPTIKTVQDALNYRFYGDDMFKSTEDMADEYKEKTGEYMSWRERGEYNINLEKWEIKPEYVTTPLFPNKRNWNPSILT